jgi:hypothetical protein
VARLFKIKCAAEGLTGQSVLTQAIEEFLAERKKPE